MSLRDKVVGFIAGLMAAGIAFFLFQPDCYTRDGGPGTSRSGCFTKIGLETGVGPGLFFFAIAVSVIAFLCVAVVAAHVSSRVLPSVDPAERTDLRW